MYFHTISCRTLFSSKKLFAQSNTVYIPHFTNSNFSKTIDISKPVGFINATQNVNTNGSANYEIPIIIPPGTNNFTPKISISYNSQGGNGVVGFGWDINGLGAITRTNKNFYNDGKVNSINISATDDYLLDGNRLVLQSGTQGLVGSKYKCENEIYSEAEIINDCANGPWVWRVTTKEGIKIEYGSTDITNGASVNNVGNWLYWRIYKVTDLNGNYYTYTYDNTDNDSKIKEINFTGNLLTGLLPYNKIFFEYSIRQDENFDFEVGLQGNKKYILDKIIVTGENNQSFKTYSFKKSTDDMYSYLSEVTESGTDGTQLNSTIFKYGDKPIDYTLSMESFLTSCQCERYTGDFDGDGYTDILAGGTTLVSNFNRQINDFKIFKRSASNPNFVQSTPTYPLYGNFAVNEYPQVNYGLTSQDYNGDGRDDILLTDIAVNNINGYPTLTSVTIYEPNNDATSFSSVPYYNPYGNSTSLNYSGPFTFISLNYNYIISGDFNGDGKSDFITFLANDGFDDLSNATKIYPRQYKSFYNKTKLYADQNLNISNQYAIDPNKDALEFMEEGTNYPVDFNGDGKTDIMTVKWNGCKIYELVETPGGISPYKFNLLHSSGYPTLSHNIFPGDFNGDGKTDLFTIVNGIKEISYSTGTNFHTLPFIMNTGLTLSNPTVYSDDKINIADFNGDGKSDICHSGNYAGQAQINVYYSKGSSFFYQQYAPNINIGLYQPIIVDFNGDGRSELMNVNNYFSPFDVIAIKPNGTERMLHKITNGLNATLEFNYKNLTTEAPFYIKGNGGNSTCPLNTIQKPQYCVSKSSIPNGIGGSLVTNYKYEEFRNHRAGRGPLGFTKSITEKTQNDSKTVEIQTFNTLFYLSYQEATFTYKLSTNALLGYQKNTNIFTPISGNGNRFKSELTLSVDYNNLQNSTNTTTNIYDNFSNPISITKTISNLETSKTINNFIAIGSAIPSYIVETTVSNIRAGQASVSKTNKYSYDIKGNLLTKTDFFGLPNSVITNMTYNLYGNATKEIISALGVVSKENLYLYDSKGRFQIVKEKKCVTCGTGFSQKEYYNINPLWGTVNYLISSDCQTSSFEYDGFGKLLSTTLPTGVINTNTYGWDPNGVTSCLISNAGKPEVKTWYDILGREIKAEKHFTINGNKSKMLTTYNNKGLVKTRTNWHLNTEVPITTSITYDSYNRLISETNIINDYNWTFNYNTILKTLETIKTDLSGKFQKTVADATGKIIKSKDPGGSVNFRYDSWGNQFEINQNGVVIITKYFDDYNKLVKQEEVNAGEINYTYDAFGRLVNQIDARGISYNMQYDNLDRLLTKSGPEGTTTYEYYSKAESIGELNEEGNPVSNPNHHGEGLELDISNVVYKYCCNNNITRITNYNGITQLFTYDNFARLIKKDETVDGIVYTTEFKYDIYGNVISTLYPSAIQINNVYDNHGILSSVNQQGSTVSIYTANDMNGMGQVTKYTLGNGKVTTQAYFNGALTQTYTPLVQHFLYTWNYQTGNLSQRYDGIKNLTEDFTNDNNDRLTSAQIVGQPIQNFNYDPYPATGEGIGNIKTKEDVGYFRYTASQIHTQSSIANFSSIVNPPLNISINDQNITYTGFQRVNKITENGYEQQFDYWPSYERVKSVLTLNGTLIKTNYYFGNYETQALGNNAASEIHYISGAEGICAIIVIDGANIKTSYIYKDQIGSFNIITDDVGNIIAEQSYDAWGRNRNPANWTYVGVPSVPTWLTRGYTGHEDMKEFGLINMNARLYDPVTAKMISPDNYVANAYNSNDYNRYAYANSNPLSTIDPDGNHPLVVAIVIYAVFFTESGYNVQKYVSPVALHINLGFGSHQTGIGIEASIGIPQ
jgi:RHS repeat-associated protein